jgi:hypothetical protein
MELLLGGSCLALIALLGYVATSLILRPQHRHWAELIGLSFAAGYGLLGVVLFDCSLAGLAPSRAILVCIGALCAAALIALRRTLALPQWPPRITPKWGARLILGIVAVLLLEAAVANAAANCLTPGLADIDSFAIWMYKAKIVAAEALRPIPKFLLDPSLSFSHQDYPLGMPLVVAAMYSGIGRIDELYGKVPLLAAYISLVLVMYAALRRELNRATAAAVTAMLVAMPVLTANTGAAVAEVPLVLMHACCLVLLLRWMQIGGRRTLVASAVFAAFAAFMKNEGLALLPLIGFAAVLFALIRRKRELIFDWLTAAATSLVLIGPWLVYRRYLPHTHEDYGSKLTNIAIFLQNLPRLRQVLPMYVGQLWELKTAGGIWMLLILAAIVGWRALGRLPALILWMILLAHLSLYLATYTISPWDLNTLIAMVGPKLLMHAAPAAALLIGLHFSSSQLAFTQEPLQSA